MIPTTPVLVSTLTATNILTSTRTPVQPSFTATKSATTVVLTATVTVTLTQTVPAASFTPTFSASIPAATPSITPTYTQAAASPTFTATTGAAQIDNTLQISAWVRGNASMGGPSLTLMCAVFAYRADSSAVDNATTSVTDLTSGKSSPVPYYSAGEYYYLMTNNTSIIEYVPGHVYEFNITIDGHTYTDSIKGPGNFNANASWTVFTWDGPANQEYINIEGNLGSGNSIVYLNSTTTAAPYDISPFTYPADTYGLQSHINYSVIGAFNTNPANFKEAMEFSGGSITLP